MNLKKEKNFEKQYKSYKPLILIVDNDRDNLFLASCVIESLGMHHVVTDDSEKCLNLIGELLPDLILLDIVMPTINGLEITRMVRQNKNIRHIPIIAVTGLTRPQDTDRLIEAGCDDYLCKPYSLEALESRVYDCLKSVVV